MSFSIFFVILFGFEKCNILLSSANKMHFKCVNACGNHLYRWWIGVGRWHLLGEPHRLRYDWQSVGDGMTQIGICLSNSCWTTPKQRREHHKNLAFQQNIVIYCVKCLRLREVQKYCKCDQVTFKYGQHMVIEFGDCVNSRTCQ